MDNQIDKIKGITETQDVIVAVAALMVRSRAALKNDGRITWLEMVGFAGDFPALMRAISGIQDVPSELLDLSDEETLQLSGDVAAAITAVGLGHRTGDITRELMKGAVEVVRTVMNILKLPPVPEVVAE